MSAFDDFEMLTEIMGELHHESDRSAALSAGAFLDDSLALALETRFVKLSNTRKDSIFSGKNAVLSTFSSKIELAYGLGLLGELTRIDLEHIRVVRNEFAHTATKRTFEFPRIAAHCLTLTTPLRLATTFSKGGLQPDPLENNRSRYIQTVCHVSATLTYGIRNYQAVFPLPSDLP
jgi:hypothetical protein